MTDDDKEITCGECPFSVWLEDEGLMWCRKKKGFIACEESIWDQTCERIEVSEI